MTREEKKELAELKAHNEIMQKRLNEMAVVLRYAEDAIVKAVGWDVFYGETAPGGRMERYKNALENVRKWADV